MNERKRGDSIRLVTTHACQERCNFCHNEGTHAYPNTPIETTQAIQAAVKIREKVGLSVVHLTGGEPSLHPDIINLISGLKNEGFRVQMTTNGDWKPELLDRFVEARLDSLNFSIHAISAHEFWQLQGFGQMGRDLEWCEKMVERKKKNLRAALKQGLPVKINTVVVNGETTGKVIDFALEESIPLRLMRNLNNVHESEKLIQRLLSERGLVPILEEEAVGDAGGSGTVFGFPGDQTQRDLVKVKRFGDVYLPEICDNCNLKETDKCRERFYGIRIEVNPDTNQIQARLCIDRTDDSTVIPIESLFGLPIINALARQYQSG